MEPLRGAHIRETEGRAEPSVLASSPVQNECQNDATNSWPQTSGAKPSPPASRRVGPRRLVLRVRGVRARLAATGPNPFHLSSRAPLYTPRENQPFAHPSSCLMTACLPRHPFLAAFSAVERAPLEKKGTAPSIMARNRFARIEETSLPPPLALQRNGF